MLPQGPLTAQAVLICHPGTKPNKADDQPAMLSTSVLTGNPQPGSDCHSTTKLLLCIWDAHKAERVPWWRCIYTRSRCVGHDDLDLSVLPPQPLERSDYSYAPPYPAYAIFVYPTFISVK